MKSAIMHRIGSLFKEASITNTRRFSLLLLPGFSRFHERKAILKSPLYSYRGIAYDI
jgi:hypothetical protein